MRATSNVQQYYCNRSVRRPSLSRWLHLELDYRQSILYRSIHGYHIDWSPVDCSISFAPCPGGDYLSREHRISNLEERSGDTKELEMSCNYTSYCNHTNTFVAISVTIVDSSVIDHPFVSCSCYSSSVSASASQWQANNPWPLLLAPSPSNLAQLG